MAYERASNYRDDSNCDRLGLYIHCILIGVDGGFDFGFNGGFDGGLFDRFHLAVLGYQPQQSVWQLRWEAFTAISRAGFTGYYNSDEPSYRGLNPFVMVENFLKE